MRKWFFFFLLLGTVFAASLNFDAHKRWLACAELEPGMARKDVKAIFEKYRLEPANQWAAVGDGTAYEDWYWNRRENPEDDLVTLRVIVHNDKLESFNCTAYCRQNSEHRCNYGPVDCPHFQK